MTKQKWTSVFMVFLFVFTSHASQAQAKRTVKRNVAAVLFASLGGAILGLSTLSFYGEPQEHTDNITLGALVGFAAGVGYVVYDSAQPVNQNYEYTQIFDLDQKSRRSLAFYRPSSSVIRMTFDF